MSLPQSDVIAPKWLMTLIAATSVVFVSGVAVGTSLWSQQTRIRATETATTANTAAIAANRVYLIRQDSVLNLLTDIVDRRLCRLERQSNVTPGETCR